jgi:hypothetical protein
MAYFPRANSGRFLTIFHQHSTTNSPSKNHHLHHVFRKNPCKNTILTTPEKTNHKNNSRAEALPSFCLSA